MLIDLKQELKVIEKIPILKKEESSTNETLCNGHSARTQVEIETQTSISSPAKRKLPDPFSTLLTSTNSPVAHVSTS